VKKYIYYNNVLLKQ